MFLENSAVTVNHAVARSKIVRFRWPVPSVVFSRCIESGKETE